MPLPVSRRTTLGESALAHVFHLQRTVQIFDANE
jgi:hypothetical protein